jgi:hypothetical protein
MLLVALCNLISDYRKSEKRFKRQENHVLVDAAADAIRRYSALAKKVS